VLVRSDTPLLLADRYSVERRLGRGGMGTVYAAHDLQLNRPVAVKLLRDRLESDRAVEKCRREARAAAGLAHPNVVTIHDIGLTADGRPFLVMQLLRGRTLREALGAGPLLPRQIRHVFEGVCAALEAAHAEGLVHRDLKPENVFLVNDTTDAGTVKLLDFGISTFVGDQGTSSRTGVLGTPEYAPPEQIRGEPPTPAWDVWALSIMAFEAAVGLRPVACVSAALAGPLAADGPWNGPALHRLTPALATLFADALSLDTAQRPQSASAFFDRLRRALD
jgi:serine/threonine-protein kinase